MATIDRARWRRLEPLLDGALDLPPAERAAYLARACRGDLALRAEVEVLLARCDDVERYLDVPAAIAYAPLLHDERAAPAPPPTLGDRYHIVREIACGGMATVYLAEDRKHARPVAVKVFRAAPSRPAGRAQFDREIEIAATLSHPHVLPLYDSGVVPAPSGEPACLYYVSPYVAGESLRDRLDRAPALTPEEVRRLGLEIASALDYAHRQGVIHLDVKPGNILLQEGHAVVADFGIARAASEVAAHAVGRPLGTPAYMSPEQARLAPDLDARSDVYSLGCVLYEMLVGAAPFAGETLEGALARGHAPVAAPAEPLRARTPRALADVVLAATAPERADRVASAAALARALEAMEPLDAPGLTERGEASWWRRVLRRPRLAALGAIAAAATTLGLAHLFKHHPLPLDPSLVAVAPFDTPAPALTLWREGLVDVLSRDLDGAGPLRAVPASRVMANWVGRSDEPSAIALARRTGARYVVAGGLVPAGRDSVRVSVVLIDACFGTRVAELERRDVADRVDRVADSLAVGVLRELGRRLGTDLARATASPTTSLAALKAYLRGEQFYRAARWDSAQSHFEHAIALDSSFALAYHRLAAVTRWRGADSGAAPDSTPYALMRLPAKHARGLGPRERLLARVDSLTADAHFAAAADRPRATQALLDALDAGVRRYPEDAELAYLRADAWARHGFDVAVGGVDDRDVVRLFDHAIALDSSFAPAYVVPMTRVAYLDGAAAVRRYTRAFLAVDGVGPHAPAISLVDALLADPARAAATARIAATLPADALCELATLLRHVPEDGGVIVALGESLERESLERESPGGAGADRSACAVSATIEGLQFRGRLRAARRLAAARARWAEPRALYDLARFASDSARAELRRALERRPNDVDTWTLAWLAERGDTAALRRALRVAQRTRAEHERARAAELRARLAATRAYLSLARGDTTAAIAQLAAAPDSLGPCRGDVRLTLATLLVRARRDDDARRQLERPWPGGGACGDGVDDVRWAIERARLLERDGRRDQAAAAYARVASAWRDADEELQPVAREARAAADRLRSAAAPVPNAGA